MPETQTSKASDDYKRDRVRASKRERRGCLLYTSDAADEALSVYLGGRRIIKKNF